MIELIFSFVFAAAAGAPAPAAEAEAPAQASAAEAESAVTPGEAEEAATETAETAATEEAAEEVQVCTYEVRTGSNMRRRVCRSQSQLDAERAAAARDLDRLRRPMPTVDENR